LQENVFLKVFELAEIAKYTPEEAAEYESSLKVYRDLKNVIDCAYDEGKAEGVEIGLEKGAQQTKLEIARKLMAKGMSAEEAAEIAGVAVDDF